MISRAFRRKPKAGCRGLHANRSSISAAFTAILCSSSRPPSCPAIAGKGDHPSAKRSDGGRGAGLVENSFDDNEATSQKPPPPRFAWSPSPAIAGAERQSAPGLAARFLFAREFFIPPCSLTPSPLRHSWVFSLCPPRPQTKGEAERRETHVLTAPCGRGRTLAERARLSASHCGSGQGDSWSPGLSIRPCFGRAVRGV